MIKVRTNEGEVEVEMSGSVKEITADACVILQAIYMGLEEENILSAISFRANVLKHILEGRAMHTVVEGEDAR